MNKVIIKTPMWKNGGSVGIADRQFASDGVLVEIAYKGYQLLENVSNRFSIS